MPEGKLPYTVGGLFAVWRREDDMDFIPILGVEGQGEDELEVDNKLLVGFENYTIPTDEAVLNVATYLFPTCTAITFFYNSLTIEFPLSSDDDSYSRLEDLPGSIRHAPFILQYQNGPLVETELRRRAMKPTPQNDLPKRKEDHTDYVKLDGKFYPGCMISSWINMGRFTPASQLVSWFRRGTSAVSCVPGTTGRNIPTNMPAC